MVNTFDFFLDFCYINKCLNSDKIKLSTVHVRVNHFQHVHHLFFSDAKNIVLAPYEKKMFPNVSL